MIQVEWHIEDHLPAQTLCQTCLKRHAGGLLGAFQSSLCCVFQIPSCLSLLFNLCLILNELCNAETQRQLTARRPRLTRVWNQQWRQSPPRGSSPYGFVQSHLTSCIYTLDVSRGRYFMVGWIADFSVVHSVTFSRKRSWIHRHWKKGWVETVQSDSRRAVWQVVSGIAAP